MGKVPAHWETRRIKNWLVVNQSVLPEDTDPNYAFAYLEIGSIGTGRIVETPETIRFEDSPSRARRVVKSGDTIVSTVRTYLKAVWHADHPDSDLVVSTGFAVLTPRSGACPKFVSYLCQNEAFTSRVAAESVGVAYPAIAETRLANFHVGVPPVSEQSAIVRFLDRADQRIRHHIRVKEKLISLLVEQKQAAIHQAVTGRIDVRTGQPYPAYKRSGVECLGEVPAHWNVMRLRQCGTMVGGMTPSMGEPRFWDGDIPWVTPKDMKLEAIHDSSMQITKAALRETSIRLIEPPAVLMVVRGMILARRVPIAWITSCVTINQDMKAVVPAVGIKVEFLARALDSAQDALATFIDEAGHGTRRLPTERLRTLTVAFPPEDEQSLVVRFVDQTTTEIDKRIVDARREIDLLREYRTRLIANVVTGELDVREAAAALPEEPDDPDTVEAECLGPEGGDDGCPDRDRRTAVPAAQEEMTP